MIRTMLRLAILAALALAVVVGWPDIRRYVTMRLGTSTRPAKVPAKGRTAYPQREAAGQPDGTGDFDSAMRGGPARR